MIWIGRIETESELHQYFLNISKDYDDDGVTDDNDDDDDGDVVDDGDDDDDGEGNFSEEL